MQLKNTITKNQKNTLHATITVIKKGLSQPHELSNNWKNQNQIIEFEYNGKILVAIDNLTGTVDNKTDKLGGLYEVGKTYRVELKNISTFLWIKQYEQ